jgi:hypothetical protein
MIIALAIYCMSFVTGAACGAVYAHMNGYDETMHTILGAVLPPVACFYALTIIMTNKD